MKRSGYSQQQGHAALIFALFIPALFAFFALSVEGSRYLNTKARLGDVTEVASLALAARNSDDNTANKALAKEYIDLLMPDAKDDIEIHIKRLTCEQISGCGTPGVYDEKGFRFNEYQLVVKTKHDTWFQASSDDDTRFADEVSVGSSAVARKYQGEPIDVVFVSDFSGSMNWSWNGEVKITKLKQVLSDVAKEVIRYSEDRTTEKNTVGFAAFNNLTAISSSCKITHLCPSSESGCTNDKYLYNASDVSISKTIDNLFVSKNSCITGSYKKPGGTDNSSFYTLPLTTDITTGFISSINAMKADGYTASFEGLIEGAQLALSGDNPRRLIVILSDGQDKPSDRKSIMTKLVTDGMCDKIRDTIDQQTTSKGKEVKSKIAVIGINYDVNNDPNLGNCAGTENVFTATNMNDVYNKLLDLISEEIGRLYSYD